MATLDCQFDSGEESHPRKMAFFYTFFLKKNKLERKEEHGWIIYQILKRQRIETAHFAANGAPSGKNEKKRGDAANRIQFLFSDLINFFFGKNWIFSLNFQFISLNRYKSHRWDLGQSGPNFMKITSDPV